MFSEVGYIIHPSGPEGSSGDYLDRHIACIIACNNYEETIDGN
jgi:hypothetical protein